MTTKTSENKDRYINKTDDIIKLDMEEGHSFEKKEPAKNEPVQQKTNYASYFSTVFWSEYFDINQTEMFERILIVAHPQKMNLGSIIKTKPELYGPFWICSTIIFCLFAFGNLSSYLVGHPYSYEYISSASFLMYGLNNKISPDSPFSYVLFNEDSKC